jgi:hypothetical protein
MKNLPITLIIVLTHPLLCGTGDHPGVFSATFIRIGPDRKNNMPNKKSGLPHCCRPVRLAGLFYLAGWNTGGTLALICHRSVS